MRMAGQVRPQAKLSTTSISRALAFFVSICEEFGRSTPIEGAFRWDFVFQPIIEQQRAMPTFLA
jgi:hypothetical protein